MREAGQRVAVSLPGVERREVRRGDALVAPGAYPVSYRLDVELDELEEIADGARVQALLGTAHTTAKVVRAGERWAQLRLAAPVVAARGDRVILRGETTLGGARILDPAPARHRDAARFEALDRGEVRPSTRRSASTRSAMCSTGSPRTSSAPGPGSSPRAWLDELEGDLRARIAAADPIDPGVSPPPEPWAADVLPLLPFELRGAKLYEPGATASLGAREAEAAELERELADAGMRATKVEDVELARFLEARGALVRLGPEHAIGAAAYERRATRSSPSAPQRETSRSPASATSSARGDATRSSSSSASTGTG